MEEISNVLTEEYLAELYNAAMDNSYLCGVVVRYMKNEYLPDRHYQTLNGVLSSHYKEYRSAPTYPIVRQMLSGSRGALELLDEIKDFAKGSEEKALLMQFENYLKLAEFKRAFKEIGECVKTGDGIAARRMFQQKAHELEDISLARDKFVDVAKTFEERAVDNRHKCESETSNSRPVTRFYIDELDLRNNGQNLRKQLTCVFSMSGVGKSHFARYIGKCAAYEDGLDVLHIQLEGSEAEVLNAYSASLVSMETFEYERGNVNEHMMKMFRKQIEMCSGTLKVVAYPAFEDTSTADIKTDIEDYRKLYSHYPAVIIVDSADLLADSTGKSYDAKSQRIKILNVMRELKKIAEMTNSWVVTTYQATIEDKEWVNDERNVLDGYNTAECKGLQRPCTHLISLNQSKREEAEETMRLNVAKSRFFRKGRPFRICTDYGHESFYDRERTLNLPRE